MCRFLLILCLFAFVPFSWAEKEKKYTTKFDNIDLKEVVKNERLLKNYVDCLLEKGRCTPDGLELRGKSLERFCYNFIYDYFRKHP